MHFTIGLIGFASLGMNILLAEAVPNSVISFGGRAVSTPVISLARRAEATSDGGGAVSARHAEATGGGSGAKATGGGGGAVSARRAEATSHVYGYDVKEKRHEYGVDQDEAAKEKRHEYDVDQDEATKEKRHEYDVDQDETA